MSDASCISRHRASFVLALFLWMTVFGPTMLASAQEPTTSAAGVEEHVLNAPGDSSGEADPGRDVLEADDLIRVIFTSADTSRYADAARAYETILRTDPNRLDDEAAFVRRRHVAALRVVAPGGAVRSAVEQLDTNGSGDLVDAHAQRIFLWWRSHDPFPGTRRNERMDEHLARFVHALELYGDTQDRRGFDDRGEVLIRLGPPSGRLSLEIPDVVRAFDFQDVVHVPDLPDNELWLYPDVHDEAFYFFVRPSRRGGFHLGLPSDVFPRRMMTGHDLRNRRGRARAEMALSVLEGTYAQLALAHPFFGSIYDQIAHYHARIPGSRERPDRFIQTTMAEATARESESQGRRDRLVPAFVTNTRGITEDLPVSVRWARFLDADGSTRTEIFWSLDGAGLSPSNRLIGMLENDGYAPSEAYLVTFSAARQSPDYLTREIETRHFRIRPPVDRELATQLLVLRGDTGRFHLGLQWNQFWTTNTAADSVDVGALLKVATLRVDSLEALHGEGEYLEVSDLKPVFPSEGTPYPFEAIDPSAPPDLVFELYNLHYGPDDQTHYTVEYTVSRATGRRATRVESRMNGPERDTRERIAIELGDAEAGEQVRLSVRATDEVTGETVERSISFRLAEDR